MTPEEIARQVCVKYGLICTDIDKDREHPLESYIAQAIRDAVAEERERWLEMARKQNALFDRAFQEFRAGELSAERFANIYRLRGIPPSEAAIAWATEQHERIEREAPESAGSTRDLLDRSKP